MYTFVRNDVRLQNVLDNALGQVVRFGDGFISIALRVSMLANIYFDEPTSKYVRSLS